MAYANGSLVLWAHGNDKKLFRYDSATDTLATIAAAGYFNNTDDDIRLAVDDMIKVVASDGIGTLMVASISAAGAVTTSGGVAAAAEHGAGAIGTAATPTTSRRSENGVIITQTKIDLTGLTSVATANDVIGLSGGGVAFIGKNDVAVNGVIFKVELSCLETPVGGDNDVNVVANASDTLEYDGAGGTSYLANAGDLVIGQTIQNLTPGLTADDSFYLTAGTGDTAAIYTAGMYVLTTYGHAPLV